MRFALQVSPPDATATGRVRRSIILDMKDKTAKTTKPYHQTRIRGRGIHLGAYEAQWRPELVRRRANRQSNAHTRGE
jgi:hypothetical protein